MIGNLFRIGKKTKETKTEPLPDGKYKFSNLRKLWRLIDQKEIIAVEFLGTWGKAEVMFPQEVLFFDKQGLAVGLSGRLQVDLGDIDHDRPVSVSDATQSAIKMTAATIPMKGFARLIIFFLENDRTFWRQQDLHMSDARKMIEDYFLNREVTGPFF